MYRRGQFNFSLVVDISNGDESKPSAFVIDTFILLTFFMVLRKGIIIGVYHFNSYW